MRDHNAVEETIEIGYSGEIQEGLKGYNSTFNNDTHELIVTAKNVKLILPDVVKKCSDAGIDIINIDIKSISLENIFLNLTGRHLRD